MDFILPCAMFLYFRITRDMMYLLSSRQTVYLPCYRLGFYSVFSLIRKIIRILIYIKKSFFTCRLFMFSQKNNCSPKRIRQNSIRGTLLSLSDNYQDYETRNRTNWQLRVTTNLCYSTRILLQSHNKCQTSIYDK